MDTVDFFEILSLNHGRKEEIIEIKQSPLALEDELFKIAEKCSACFCSVSPPPFVTTTKGILCFWRRRTRSSAPEIGFPS